jgi:hypothetical protein
MYRHTTAPRDERENRRPPDKTIHPEPHSFISPTPKTQQQEQKVKKRKKKAKKKPVKADTHKNPKSPRSESEKKKG